MSYFRQAASGFSWHTAFKISASLCTLLKISLLARLLSPAEFGVFSLTTIALGITEAATETGVNVTIMQSKHSISYFLDSAWVISIFRGIVIGIVMMALGFFLQGYFGEPRLVFLIGILSLVPVIKGAINPMIISYYKEMRFLRDSVYRLSLIMVDATAAVALAFWLHSAYALVGGMVIAALFEVFITFFLFTERPHFAYAHSRGKHILSNAKWLSLSAFFSYLSENLDNFLIGKLTGTFNLGLYHNAYALSHKPNYEIAKAVQHSTFPILTQLFREQKSLASAFKKSSFVVLVIAVAGSLPLILFPHWIVMLVLGEQWVGVTPLLPWLVGAGIIHAMAMYASTLFVSTRRYFLTNLHLGVSLLTMVGFVYFLSQWYGIQGAVIGLFMSRLLAAPIALYGAYYTLKHQ